MENVRFNGLPKRRCRLRDRVRSSCYYEFAISGTRRFDCRLSIVDAHLTDVKAIRTDIARSTESCGNCEAIRTHLDIGRTAGEKKLSESEEAF